MSQFGQAADNSSCTGVQPADQLQCNVMPCDFCSLTDCAGQVGRLLTCQTIPSYAECVAPIEEASF